MIRLDHTLLICMSDRCGELLRIDLRVEFASNQLDPAEFELVQIDSHIPTNNLVQGMPLHRPHPKNILMTDASLVGWGGICTHGLWTSSESLHHINFLELCTVLLAVQSFLPYLMG